MCERLGAEADREERRPRGDESAQQLVLLLEPRVAALFADVLVAAEHERRVKLAGGARLGSDLPLDELVPALADHLAEELRPNLRPVVDGEDAHRGQP